MAYLLVSSRHGLLTSVLLGILFTFLCMQVVGFQPDVLCGFRHSTVRPPFKTSHKVIMVTPPAHRTVALCYTFHTLHTCLRIHTHTHTHTDTQTHKQTHRRYTGDQIKNNESPGMWHVEGKLEAHRGVGGET